MAKKTKKKQHLVWYYATAIFTQMYCVSHHKTISPPFVLVSFPLDLGQHVVQSPDLWRNGVDLDPDAIRLHPGDSWACAARFPPTPKAAGVVEGPDGAGEEPRGGGSQVVGVGAVEGGVLLVDVGDALGRLAGTLGTAAGDVGRRGGEVGVGICGDCDGAEVVGQQVPVVGERRRRVEGGREEAAGHVG